MWIIQKIFPLFHHGQFVFNPIIIFQGAGRVEKVFYKKEKTLSVERFFFLLFCYWFKKIYLPNNDNEPKSVTHTHAVFQD